MTPQEINDLRSRVLAGEKVPPEELAAALKVLRGARASASVVSTTARKKAAPQTEAEATAQLNDLLGGLGL